MLRQFVLNSADRNRHLAEKMRGTWRQWEDVCLADLEAPAAFGNQAILLCPITDGTQTGDVVARLREGFAGTHVIFSAWPTPDLRPYGYALVGHPPFMVRHQGGAAPVRPTGLVVEEVTDAASIEKYERVFVEGYPVPELQPYSPGRLFGERILGGIARAWVGSVDGRPVAGSMAINPRGLIAVENVATLPDARGHGYGGAVTATAALSAPDLPSALIASDDGRSVYERLGFLPISRFTLWVAA
jgi:GNAT superfamily N-acetyltransferase